MAGAETGLTAIRRAGLWPRLLLISAGIGLHAFNEFAIAGALPRAAVAFQGQGIIGLVPAFYAIGAVAGGMTGVLIRRRLGVRAAMLCGVAVFLLGALMALWAPGMGWLVLGRGISGISEGLIMAICYSLIPELFPADMVPAVFAAEAVVWAAAGVLGPLAGGTLTEWLGWRVSMLTALPVLLVFVTCCLRVLPDEPADRAALGGLGRLWPVAISLTGAAIISAPALLTGAGLQLGLLLAGVGFLVLAFRLDSRQDNPVFPRRSFRGDRMGLGMWVMALISFAHYLAQPFTALGLQEMFGLTATWVGIGSVTLALSWSVVAIVTSHNRFDRWRPGFAMIGPLGQAAGAGLMAVGMGFGNLALIICGQVVIGAGFALMWGPVAQAVMEAAPSDERDRAGGIMPTIAALGSAIGAGIGGIIALQTDLATALGQPTGAGAAALVQWGVAAGCGLIGAAAGLGLKRAGASPEAACS